MGRLKLKLYHLLGGKVYRKIVNLKFFFLFKTGLMQLRKSYQMHYFVKKLLREDDIVIDIGANLGHYSIIFAEKCIKGKVYAIEPITEYCEIIEYNKRILTLKISK